MPISVSISPDKKYLLVADIKNYRIRRVTLHEGQIETVRSSNNTNRFIRECVLGDDQEQRTTVENSAASNAPENHTSGTDKAREASSAVDDGEPPEKMAQVTGI